MAIPESILSNWSHHRSGTESAQANVAIRNALSNYGWPKDMRYSVFLQGSYQNATNLSRVCNSSLQSAVIVSDAVVNGVGSHAGKSLRTKIVGQHLQWLCCYE